MSDKPHDDATEEAPWLSVMDAETTRAELEALIEAETERAVDALRSNLADDDDFTDAQRALVLARAEPLVRERVRENLQAIHRKLQH